MVPTLDCLLLDPTWILPAAVVAGSASTASDLGSLTAMSHFLSTRSSSSRAVLSLDLLPCTYPWGHQVQLKVGLQL